MNAFTVYMYLSHSLFLGCRTTITDMKSDEVLDDRVDRTFLFVIFKKSHKSLNASFTIPECLCRSINPQLIDTI